MKNFSWGRDAVLLSGFRISETVVAVSHEVLERMAPIRKLKRLLNVIQECLFGVTQLHFLSKKCQIVQSLNTLFNGGWITHLDHGTSFLTLKEFNSHYVSVQAKQVEQAISVHLGVFHSIHHHDRSLSTSSRLARTPHSRNDSLTLPRVPRGWKNGAAILVSVSRMKT